MSAFAQTNRLLTFSSPLGANVLLPERLAGSEGISELFRYEIELLAETENKIAPENIVGQKVWIGISSDDIGTRRYINGIVSNFVMGGGDKEFLTYRACIVPNVWLLTLRRNTRVFQNKTVIDVVKAVLGDYGISAQVDTSVTYTPMEYCTQYRETDFDFISRLLEQHGILYYFKHTKDDHTFTLQDTSSKLADCEIQDTFRYVPEQGTNAGYYDFVVRDVSLRSSLVSGKHTVWDYSFIQNRTVQNGNASVTTKSPLGSNPPEQYDFSDSSAAYVKKPESDSKVSDWMQFFAGVRRDSSDAGTRIIEGESNAISMQTGYTFTLDEASAGKCEREVSAGSHRPRGAAASPLPYADQRASAAVLKFLHGDSFVDSLSAAPQDRKAGGVRDAHGPGGGAVGRRIVHG